MPYHELPVEDQILLAIEFVGRGHPIPEQLRVSLGADLIREIENPD